ncbi:hypothetical protein [Massilia sp. CCM 8734]|uniref:hypothetical protein n=1 Tax=Massilia sp. CCM 8734 TaxID=2609283 RepID=UPI00141F6704|nr:hypothetical protein [Massilia sp. CCM 8734]NHZ99417.1 hypothetical protein [Massilia sp. CCM 8734]
MQAALIAKALASKNADDARECGNAWPPDPSVAPMLSKLLLEPWHFSHEEMVFDLAELAHPHTVTPIFQAANTYLDYLVNSDNQHSFQRKCAFALAGIGTIGSRLALEELAESTDQMLRKYARECLRRWKLRTDFAERIGAS